MNSTFPLRVVKTHSSSYCNTFKAVVSTGNKTDSCDYLQAVRLLDMSEPHRLQGWRLVNIVEEFESLSSQKQPHV